jgi:hypothetical protein
VSNPTGTVYLSANSSYTWTDGDVYQIPQTDEVEGAATGASFLGLGVENQPHQVLLNKIQYTHAKQLVDETNISILQTFAGLFTSSMGVNGWIKLGAQDVSLGQIQPILMWGAISLLGLPSGITDQTGLNNTLFTFNWPLAGGFPNACLALYPYFQSNCTTGRDDDLAIFGSVPLVLEAISPLSKTGPNTIASDRALAQGAGVYPAYPSINIAQTPNDGQGFTAIGWWAIGY